MPSDCGNLDKNLNKSGIYTIYPRGLTGFKVFCEMDKAGGGWTVFQHRQDGSVDFYRDWKTYQCTFGSLNGEFWLGNDLIHLISSQGLYTLRVEVEDFENNRRYAEYSTFKVGDEESGYELQTGTYRGNAGDSMVLHSSMKFTTKDADNDVRSDYNCAIQYEGAWWYYHCHNSNLNGMYLTGRVTSYAHGLIWQTFKGYYYSLQNTTMMMKRTV